MTMSTVPVGKSLLGRLRLGGRDEARQPPDLDREALEALDEIRDNAGGRAGWWGRPARPAVPAIAATKAARSATSVLPKPTSPQTSRSIGLPASRSPKHVVDRAVLVVGLLIGKAVDESGVAARPVRATTPGARGAHGRGLDQLARDLADPLLHPRLAALPGLAAEPVERHAFALAAVAGQDLDILDRDVELVAARIFERDAVVRRPCRRGSGSAPRSGRCRDRRGRRDRPGDSVASSARNASAALRFLRRRTSRSPSMSCSVSTATSGVVKPWSSGRTSSAAAVLTPSASCQLSTCLEPFEAVVLEQSGQPLAGAASVAREHDLAAGPAKLGDMLRPPPRRYSLCCARSGAKSRAGWTAKSMTAALSGSGKVEARWIGRSVDRASPFALRQVQRDRLERAVAARLALHRPHRGS